MEDSHATILSLDEADGGQSSAQSTSPQKPDSKSTTGINSFFAVYDGHGGKHYFRLV